MNHQNKRPASNAGDEDGDRSPQRKQTPLTLSHPISPPTKKRRLAPAPIKEQTSTDTQTLSVPNRIPGVKTYGSPFQLTRIRDLPPELNRDTVSLKDILGDPLISECWEFNYLHDIDFLMSSFDEDVRHLVKVHVVHGFWKREDPHRAQLEEAASRFPNVTLHAAFLPEMFGTHHSKMLVLFRHDDTAQVIIHTANMIVRDWTNMTQAAWLSPMLPLLPLNNSLTTEQPQTGNGAKFKIDLINYLRAYDSRRPTCKALADQLQKYSFSSIKGALISSVPGRHMPDSQTKFGWPAIKEALQSVPLSPSPNPEIAVQISSIATLGPTDTWLKNTFFAALAGGIIRDKGKPGGGGGKQTPKFKVVFPTPDEIRRSLDGYQSGGSIHTKIQSAQQAKQLQYLKPVFCHWANDAPGGAALPPNIPIKEAGRKRAAPHIKTYIRYSDPPDGSAIDWALLTSANLSKQAWGDTARPGSGEVRVSSYEIGVLVWPGLFDENAVMQATFVADDLGGAGHADQVEGGESAKGKGKGKETGKEVVGGGDEAEEQKVIVPLRMPYNLPLQGYGGAEVPWVATASYSEPDWMGRIWQRD